MAEHSLFSVVFNKALQEAGLRWLRKSLTSCVSRIALGPAPWAELSFSIGDSIPHSSQINFGVRENQKRAVALAREFGTGSHI